MEIPASLEKEVSDLEAVVAKFQLAAEKIDGLSQELVALNQLDASLQVRPYEIKSVKNCPVDVGIAGKFHRFTPVKATLAGGKKL